MLSFFKSSLNLETPLKKDQVTSLLRENIILRQGDLNRNKDNEGFYFSGIVTENSFELRKILYRQYNSIGITLNGKLIENENNTEIILTITTNTFAYVFFFTWFLSVGLISVVALYKLLFINFIKAILPLLFGLFFHILIQNEYRINTILSIK